MTINFHEERMQDRAGRVALEFLRANPSSNVAETITNYNQIFERVYRHMKKVAKEGRQIE